MAGRSPDRPEEQNHPALGETGNTSLSAQGPADPPGAYIFGAICPARGVGAGLVLPRCNTDAINLHLQEISVTVASGAHALLMVDQAGWHPAKELKTLDNITIMPLPSKSPELNPVENIWQFMRENRLSNRIFTSCINILDHSCFAWNQLIDQPWKIMSIGLREWANQYAGWYERQIKI